MGAALTIILGVLMLGLGVAVNWLLWFRLIPMVYRQMRDQFRANRVARSGGGK